VDVEDHVRPRQVEEVVVALSKMIFIYCTTSNDCYLVYYTDLILLIKRRCITTSSSSARRERTQVHE
jgi:hypothetical protein